MFTLADHAAGRARGHHHDPIGQRDGLVQIVVMKISDRFQPATDQAGSDASAPPGVDVERRERFVHQNDLGLHDQGLRHGDALALAA